MPKLDMFSGVKLSGDAGMLRLMMRILSCWLGMVVVVLAGAKPNVLFIAVDDLNDWVGFLGGHPDTRTPNMDRLAKRGVVFTKAYCVSPICGPSRAAVLTGMRPETSGVYHNKGTYVDYVPKAEGLPLFLKNRGYHVMGAGKLNHGMGMVVAENWHEYGPDAGAIGGPFTWEELNMTPGKKVERKDIAAQGKSVESGIVKNVYPGKVIKRGTLEATLPLNGIDNLIDRPANGYNTFDWGPVTVTDDEMPDGMMAAWAEKQLAKEYDKPFFIGVGFYRPHQPWYAPAKYFEPFEGKTLALPPMKVGDLSDLGEAARHYAHYAWSGSYATVVWEKQMQDALRGYLAAIHFADAQVGRLLDALDASPHRDNTLVILWSDHGWELGEKEHWGKHSPWEGSIRVPLVIVPPRNAGGKPSRQESLVSLLDLYPTIADYAGLDLPKGLDGKSLRPLVEGKRVRVREHSVTTLGRASHAIRQGKWKYIHYYDAAEELYDLEKDPNEWVNLAPDAGQRAVLEEMRALIPDDRHFSKLVRMGKWKAVLGADGKWMLFDMLHPASGIGEQNDLAQEFPAVLEKIVSAPGVKGAEQRYVTVPE